MSSLLGRPKSDIWRLPDREPQVATLERAHIPTCIPEAATSTITLHTPIDPTKMP